jgi:hypothetical protein
MKSRRWILAAPLAALLLPSAAHAQGDGVTAIFDGISATFATSTKITARLVAAVDALKPSKFKKKDRPAIAAQMDEFQRALSDMAAAKSVMMLDLNDYINRVRTNGYVANSASWADLQDSLRALSRRVAIVQRERAAATWLKNVLTPEEEVQFGDALAQREILIARLRDLPPPHTPAEMERLAALRDRHQALVEQLDALRTALAGASRRFVA